MSAHRLLLATALLSSAAIAGCAGGLTPPSAGPSIGRTPAAPAPTAVPLPTPRPTPAATPATGGVHDARGPELTIVSLDDTTIVVELAAPAAKAWRVEVNGTGAQAGDAWLITVETGDTAPLVTATEVVGGTVIDALDLTGVWDGTAIAGGCHSTLPVCLESDGFRLPEDGDGTFAVHLHLLDGAASLSVGAAAAYWEGEPFILGPWHATDAFPWEPAAG